MPNKRNRPPLTAEQKAEQLRVRQLIEGEKPALMAKGRAARRQHEARLAHLRTIFESLKAEREAQGLSLADMQTRTGMTREAISRLENLRAANPTISTIERYAEALGKRVVLQLEPIGTSR